MSDYNNYENICLQLKNILKETYNVNFNEISEKDSNNSLFSSVFRFQPWDLLSFILLVEKTFNITFNEDDIINNRCDSIEGIAQLVNNKLVSGDN